MADDKPTIAFSFGSFPEEDITVEMIFDAQLSADREQDSAIVMRLAVAEGKRHAAAMASGHREPTIRNFQFLNPQQVRQLASALELMADKIEGRAPRPSS
jgi:hypothetical protein